MSELPTRYNPKEIEDKWYKFWEEKEYFHAEADPSKKPFCIVIPPPNITGILHIGHALNNTIQDILIRHRRMLGFSTLWMPGTDHAGIATQNVVEKEIAKEGLTRQDLGRDKFLERVWRWKEEYGSTIIRQLKKLGSSCDWPRLRFTMDEDYSEVVQEVFIQLYEKGLIYRGNYIINWCPRCLTALSDEEAPHKDVEGFLYYINYPIKGSKDFVTVATTRPETMLGDVAVAVNSKDKRYQKIYHKTIILPLVERELKVIKDDIVNPKFGTGAVKVTPAHDPYDFQMAQRHNLEPILIMDPDGTINKNGGEYGGMDRFQAREAILEDLKERKLLLKVQPHQHAVGHCYRCHTMIEPCLSEQWFVKMKPLAKPAIKVVREGKIKFYPKRWTKVYLNWMENIRDWCISRQIWWGHRLPVWYCDTCTVNRVPLTDERTVNGKRSAVNGTGMIVSRTKPDSCPHCGNTNLRQDEDVLDTWFSSWLWPFATFGWPFSTQIHANPTQIHADNPAKKSATICVQSADICVQKKDLEYFYPTSVLVTAPEILFFWVARMIMAGLEFMDEVPFRDVYIHGTVRDITGTKMSKSLGNIIDPLETIEEFGTDALRFSLISITATGQDVSLSKGKFESGRNFANKIWNASRFVLMNMKRDVINVDLCLFSQKEALSLPDRWILSRFYSTLRELNKSLERYRFETSAKLLYDFFWHQFCDWYLELIKANIEDKNTQVVLYKILEKSLRLLHPFIPFITEDIWQRLPHVGESIMIQSWPHLQEKMIDKKTESKMQLIIDLIAAIRNLRNQINPVRNTKLPSGSKISNGVNIAPTQKLMVLISVNDKKLKALLEENSSYIETMAKLEKLEVGINLKKPRQAKSVVVGKAKVFIPL